MIKNAADLSEILDKAEEAILQHSSNEKINHPKHYNNLPAVCSKCGHPIECIDVVQHMNFNKGNTVKYTWRADVKDKDAEIVDLRKAIKYLEFEIERLEREMKSK